MDRNRNPLQIFWIKCQRFLRAPDKKKFVVACCIVVLIIISSFFLMHGAKRKQAHEFLFLRKKLLHYCNPAGPPLGNEQNIPLEYAQFRLKQVQVVIRHGDRSSTTGSWSVAKTSPHHAQMMPFNCELKSQNSQHAKKLELLKKAQKFLKVVHVHEHERDEIIQDFLLTEKKICRPGQLTGKGYLQHIYLGEYMNNVYGRRLDLNVASVEEEEVIVYATPFTRTQQSAAAFLAGLLDKVFRNIPGNDPKRSSLKIRVSPDKLGYFREDENNDVPFCSERQRIFNEQSNSKAYRDGIAGFQPLMHKISRIFNVSTLSLPSMTSIFDIIASHHSHHHPRSCGPGGCIDDEIKLEVLKSLGWLLKMKYTPTAKLAIHPLLSKITQGMLKHAQGEGHTKFTLYSTHDSTVAPLLIELGIFQNEWPPYASRIVFELWEAGGLLGSKLKGEDLDKFFIRVLHDGHDFTRKVKFCQGKLKFDKLCPLKAFVGALEGNSESMESEYKKLCVRT